MFSQVKQTHIVHSAASPEVVRSPLAPRHIRPALRRWRRWHLARDGWIQLGLQRPRRGPRQRTHYRARGFRSPGAADHTITLCKPLLLLLTVTLRRFPTLIASQCQRQEKAVGRGCSMCFRAVVSRDCLSFAFVPPKRKTQQQTRNRVIVDKTAEDGAQHACLRALGQRWVPLETGCARPTRVLGFTSRWRREPAVRP